MVLKSSKKPTEVKTRPDFSKEQHTTPLQDSQKSKIPDSFRGLKTPLADKPISSSRIKCLIDKDNTTELERIAKSEDKDSEDAVRALFSRGDKEKQIVFSGFEIWQEGGNKGNLIIELAYKNIDELIRNPELVGKDFIYMFASCLSEDHCRMNLSILIALEKNNRLAEFAYYIFGGTDMYDPKELFEGQLLFDSFSTILIEAIEAVGGIKAFAQNQNYEYILLLFGISAATFEQRKAAIDEYLTKFFDASSLKQFVLMAPNSDIASYLISRIGVTVAAVSEVETKIENISLMVWYVDCADVRGRNDNVSQHIRSILLSHGETEECLDSLLVMLLGSKIEKDKKITN